MTAPKPATILQIAPGKKNTEVRRLMIQWLQASKISLAQATPALLRVAHQHALQTIARNKEATNERRAILKKPAPGTALKAHWRTDRRVIGHPTRLPKH